MVTLCYGTEESFSSFLIVKFQTKSALKEKNTQRFPNKSSFNTKEMLKKILASNLKSHI